MDSNEVPFMVKVWRNKPLHKRLEQAARDYRVPREHPALAGMIEPMAKTAWRYGLEKEALAAYLDSTSSEAGG